MRIVTAVFTSLLLAAGAGLPAYAQTTLKLGHVSSADNVYHLGAVRFAERVAALTNGSVKVDTLCCAQLGNDVAQAKTVQLGAQDLAIVSSNNLAQFYAPIDIFSMPALFEDIPSAQKAVFGPVGAEFFETVRMATGRRGVATRAGGGRAWMNKRRSICKRGALRGLRCR
jgi:TRAP-type C4-dicarboxylate transport system substrate-binding protein